MTPGKNPDGSMWTVAQWHDHARAELAKPKLSDYPRNDALFREAWNEMLKAPEDFVPEQMANYARHVGAAMVASVKVKQR